MKKKKYIIVGDDNYWYATTQPVTEDELKKIISDTKKMIKKGGMFMPTPSSEPNELTAYPIGDGINFPIS
jgi:hypothetical protein